MDLFLDLVNAWGSLLFAGLIVSLFIGLPIVGYVYFKPKGQRMNARIQAKLDEEYDAMSSPQQQLTYYNSRRNIFLVFLCLGGLADLVGWGIATMNFWLLIPMAFITAGWIMATKLRYKDVMQCELPTTPSR